MSKKNPEMSILSLFQDRHQDIQLLSLSPFIPSTHNPPPQKILSVFSYYPVCSIHCPFRIENYNGRELNDEFQNKTGNFFGQHRFLRGNFVKNYHPGTLGICPKKILFSKFLQ